MTIVDFYLDYIETNLPKNYKIFPRELWKTTIDYMLNYHIRFEEFNYVFIELLFTLPFAEEFIESILEAHKALHDSNDELLLKNIKEFVAYILLKKDYTKSNAYADLKTNIKFYNLIFNTQLTLDFENEENEENNVKQEQSLKTKKSLFPSKSKNNI